MPTDDAMQNRYVGDIGDYVKLSILRALSPGYRLGVAWWLYPDESHNKDGRHIGYFGRPDQWRHFDPGLFDALAQIVKSDRREVRALETADVLPGATFASEVIPVGGPISDRPNERRQWLTRVQSTLGEANMVFVDPDNGLEPAGYSHASSKSGKTTLISELREMMRPGRCLIVYVTITPAGRVATTPKLDIGLIASVVADLPRWTLCGPSRIRPACSSCLMRRPMFGNGRSRLH
jgi:hypothetical protein